MIHRTRVQKISRLEIGIWESVNGIHLVIEAPAMDRISFGESKEGKWAGKLKEHPCLYQRRRKSHSEISREKKGKDINDKKQKRRQLEEGRSGP